MARIRDDFVFGTLAAELGTGDTTLTSPGLERLSAITSPDVAAITLYDGTAYEIVHVTAHTALADTATILRGQEGTAAQSWAVGDTWLHGPTETDLNAATGSAVAASGIASFTSTASNTAQVDAAVSGVTDPIEDLFLVTRIREAQDGGALAAPGDRWSVEDTQIGSAGAQGDLTAVPNNVRVRVRRTTGSATGYTVYVHWALVRMT